MVEIRRQNLFETDISKADVISMYLLTDLNIRLRPKLLDLKPGTRLVSHAFSMGDWTPERRKRCRRATTCISGSCRPRSRAAGTCSAARRSSPSI